MNNKSKIITSKGKMYLTVVAMASLLMMTFNVNSNMNSSMNAYASIFSDIKNVDDVGQSLECVIVVVGCEGTGSVGSSGDVIIGSGDDDNNTNGGNTPIPPITCSDACFEELSQDQINLIAIALGIELGVGEDATIAEICAAIALQPSVEALVLVLGGPGIGLSGSEIADLLNCLGIDITLLKVAAILGL